MQSFVLLKISNNRKVNNEIKRLPFSDIELSVVVGNYSHVSTGAMINGDCKIGDGCFLGSQSVLVNGISIVSGCIVGAGAEVRKDITLKGVYAGNPATLKALL